MSVINFDRIINSLQIHYFKGSVREIIKPSQLSRSIEQKNILVQQNAGNFYAGENETLMSDNSFYFIPAGQPIFFKHGKASQYKSYGKEGFPTRELREEYIKPVSIQSEITPGKDRFSLLGFDVLIYGAIPFFSILELPCFFIPFDEEMNYLMKNIILEDEQDKIGRQTLIDNLTREVTIHICRHIYTRPEYAKNISKLDFLLDRRLVNIIQHIQEHLEKDLSNETIASLAYVSKDYVGQFFKTLTKNNLQEYIENQRLEKAHLLLRTTRDSVQEISHQVGFKDPAYFSRRFKMKYLVNANQLRKQELMVN
jgi:AraC family transcriptional regulator of arabinose operon